MGATLREQGKPWCGLVLTIATMALGSSWSSNAAESVVAKPAKTAPRQVTFSEYFLPVDGNYVILAAAIAETGEVSEEWDDKEIASYSCKKELMTGFRTVKIERLPEALRRWQGSEITIYSGKEIVCKARVGDYFVRYQVLSTYSCDPREATILEVFKSRPTPNLVAELEGGCEGQWARWSQSPAPRFPKVQELSTDEKRLIVENLIARRAYPIPIHADLENAALAKDTSISLTLHAGKIRHEAKKETLIFAHIKVGSFCPTENAANETVEFSSRLHVWRQKTQQGKPPALEFLHTLKDLAPGASFSNGIPVDLDLDGDLEFLHQPDRALNPAVLNTRKQPFDSPEPVETMEVGVSHC